jgi:hypothetical protein
LHLKCKLFKHFQSRKKNHCKVLPLKCRFCILRCGGRRKLSITRNRLTIYQSALRLNILEMTTSVKMLGTSLATYKTEAKWYFHLRRSHILPRSPGPLRALINHLSWFTHRVQLDTYLFAWDVYLPFQNIYNMWIGWRGRWYIFDELRWGTQNQNQHVGLSPLKGHPAHWNSVSGLL